MNAPLNLKELERKAFRSFHQDGIWDIFFGMMMLAMYTFTVLNNLDNPALRVIGLLFLEISAVFFLIYGKKEITAPRLGHVEFRAERKRRLGYIIIINLISLLAFGGLILYRQANPGQWSDLISPFVTGALIILMTSMIAYFLDFQRLYIYALIYGAAFTAVLILDLPVLFLVAALLILLPGIVIFFRFLKNFSPVQ